MSDARMFNPLRIKQLRSISLQCTDIDAAHRFYTGPWGLESTHRDDQRLCMRGTGPEHHIVEFVIGDQPGLRHITFAAGVPADVDAAAEYVTSRGIALEIEPFRNAEPGAGYECGFRDLEGRLIKISARVPAVAPRITECARPTGLSHVVLNTIDIDAATEFWTELLGFRISDWSEEQMVFLRCNPNHHSIAFNRAEWTSVNHIAYELPNVEFFLESIGRLKQHGIEPLWGAGRHGPGNNPFGYYGDPVGYVPEVTTALSQVDEASWIPRVWQRVPDQSDLWGTAGPPSAEVRAAMAGRPDPSAPSSEAGSGS